MMVCDLKWDSTGLNLVMGAHEGKHVTQKDHK